MNFEQASMRCGWAISAIHMLTVGLRGVPPKVLQQVLDSLVASWNLFHPVIEPCLDGLACLSDGPVRWDQGRGLGAFCADPTAIYPHVWSSAHEACYRIVQLALDSDEVGSDRWQAAWAISKDEVAELQERIKRERNKYLKANGATTATAPPCPLAIIVDLKCLTVCLPGGTPEDVSSERALRWLQVLVDRPEEWISSRDLSQFDPDLIGAKPHVLKTYLPKSIQALIDSETGKGSRFRRPK